MKNICVFCGSSYGNNKMYSQHAVKIGKLIGANGLNLVYGGGKLGLMGEVANAVINSGGNVFGVIPHFFLEQEIGDVTNTDLLCVDSMHERKEKMAEMADAFIVLPGGYGTLEEFAEIVTWAKLRIHNKPIALLNVNGFFDSLLNFFDHAFNEGFLHPPEIRNVFIEASEPSILMELILAGMP